MFNCAEKHRTRVNGIVLIFSFKRISKMKFCSELIRTQKKKGKGKKEQGVHAHALTGAVSHLGCCCTLAFDSLLTTMLSFIGTYVAYQNIVLTIVSNLNPAACHFG